MYKNENKLIEKKAFYSKSNYVYFCENFIFVVFFGAQMN